MARMRRDMSLLSDEVKRCVLKSDSELSATEFVRNKDYILSLLIPFEIKITKSKEGRRDIVRYLLFCQDNLKIYNSLSEFMQEFQATQANKNKLSNDINALTYYTISTLSEDVEKIQIEFDVEAPMVLDI